MRKSLRFLVLVVGILLLAVAGFAALVSVRGIPRNPVPVAAAVLPSTPARVAHGEKLALVMCAHCHRNPSTSTLSGRPAPDLGTDLGKLNSANITQDPVHGIGNWTDPQLVTLLRTGAGPDGRLRLAMPHFAYMSDEDAASIVAFLRSDNALVKATPVPNRPQEFSFLAKALTNTVMKPTIIEAHLPDAPPASDPVALGHYLVIGRYQCYLCHSNNFSTNDEAHPEKSKDYLAGGCELLDDELKTRVARNITMEPTTGIGKWSEEEFGKAVKYGMAPNGLLHVPMPKFSTMTDEEVHAIWAYLQTVPKIKKATPEDGTIATR
ncbi:MAG TPA: c-type cytochrome [Hymenobacter sp.]|jgi:mono/diheme cytochrome c family protein